jgi:hypothetical protein
MHKNPKIKNVTEIDIFSTSTGKTYATIDVNPQLNIIDKLIPLSETISDKQT